MSDDGKSKRLSIGDLSKRTGAIVETIRYYEKIGILPVPERTSSGRRIYNQDDLQRLSFVRRSRELGFTQNQVRGLLGFVDTKDSSCDDVKELTLEHLSEVRRKIDDLKKMEAVLVDMANQCMGGTVPDCPIIDALYEAEYSTARS